SRVVILADKIHIREKLAHIQRIVWRADAVRRNHMLRALLSKQRHLLFRRRCVRIRLIAVVIKRQAGIWIAIRGERHWNLFPVRVDLTPECCAPFLVHSVKRSVFSPSPVLKTLAARIAIATAKWLQREFVIDLTADNPGSLRESFCHLPGDGQREPTISFV